MNIFSFFTKTVGRKIGLGYVLAVVLTVTIGGISYLSIKSLNQTAEWVDHTSPFKVFCFVLVDAQ